MALSGVVIGVTGNFDRQILSSAVRKAGGRVDALVHKNLDYVVSDAMAIQRNTQRIRKAVKMGIPIVSEKYLFDRLKAGTEIDHTPYLMEVKEEKKGLRPLGVLDNKDTDNRDEEQPPPSSALGRTEFSDQSGESKSEEVHQHPDGSLVLAQRSATHSAQTVETDTDKAHAKQRSPRPSKEGSGRKNATAEEENHAATAALDEGARRRGRRRSKSSNLAHLLKHARTMAKKQRFLCPRSMRYSIVHS